MNKNHMIPSEALCGLLRHRRFSCSFASLRAAGAAGLHLGELGAAAGDPEGPAAGAPGYPWHPCTASN